VAALRKEQLVRASTETEVLHSQAEVDRFKHNLKKSVILSFASSRTDSVSSQKIVSMIDARPSKSRINI
jgi:hypothetical protein